MHLARYVVAAVAACLLTLPMSAYGDELNGYFGSEAALVDRDAQHELRMGIAYWTRTDVIARYGLHGCPTITANVIPDGSGALGWGMRCHIWITRDVAVFSTRRDLANYDLAEPYDVRLLRALERQRCTMIRHELGHAFGIGDEPDGPIGNAGLIVTGGHIDGDPLMTAYVQDFRTPDDCDRLAHARWHVHARSRRARRARRGGG